ncbi:MAG TPA: peptidase E [Candidatus Limnocylindrales bacterium]
MASHIVAIGGGGFSDQEELTPLDRYLIELTGKARPRVCFIGTASGDSERYAANFYRAYAPVAVASDLILFGAPDSDYLARLADQDLIFVGGGNTANLLAVWRVHGVDTLLRKAWESGTVLAGISAGAICWFEACLTDSFGPQLAALRDGVGLLHGSAAPHMAADPLRRSRFVAEIASGSLPSGYGIDDGAAAHFVGTSLERVVAEIPGRSASWFELADGAVKETRMEAIALSS